MLEESGGAGQHHVRAIFADSAIFCNTFCHDVIVTCHGGAYTAEVHAKLRQQGWKGCWIDAASSLRMSADSTIILDPVNLPIIEHGPGPWPKRFHWRQLHGQFNDDGAGWPV